MERVYNLNFKFILSIFENYFSPKLNNMDASFLNGINWAAVFVAALAYFMLGAIWYSKALFVNKWIALSKIDNTDPNAKKGMAMLMAMSFVWMFISCVGLAVLQQFMYLHNGWISGLKLGLLTGICFGAAALSITYLYEKKPSGLYLINGGYILAGNIIAAIIICSWK